MCPKSGCLAAASSVHRDGVTHANVPCTSGDCTHVCLVLQSLQQADHLTVSLDVVPLSSTAQDHQGGGRGCQHGGVC